MDKNSAFRKRFSVWMLPANNQEEGFWPLEFGLDLEQALQYFKDHRSREHKFAVKEWDLDCAFREVIRFAYSQTHGKWIKEINLSHPFIAFLFADISEKE